MDRPMVRKISTRWLWEREGRRPNSSTAMAARVTAEDRGGQGRGHGEARGEQGAEKNHPPQGDEIHLGEIDDPHGVVDHSEPQGHQGVDRPPGQPGKDELDQVRDICQAALSMAVGILEMGCLKT